LGAAFPAAAIPCAPFSGATASGILEFSVELDAPDDPPAEMMRRIRGSELQQHLVVERSRARYAMVAYANLSEAATTLLQDLEGATVP